MEINLEKASFKDFENIPGHRTRMVIVDGVYSQPADIAPLDQVVKLAGQQPTRSSATRTLMSAYISWLGTKPVS